MAHSGYQLARPVIAMTDAIGNTFWVNAILANIQPCPHPRLQIRRSECDTATDVRCMRDDGTYAAVRIFDWSDAETIAGHLRVLAKQISRGPATFYGSFNNRGRKRS